MRLWPYSLFLLRSYFLIADKKYTISITLKKAKVSLLILIHICNFELEKLIRWRIFPVYLFLFPWSKDIDLFMKWSYFPLGLGVDSYLLFVFVWIYSSMNSDF